MPSTQRYLDNEAVADAARNAVAASGLRTKAVAHRVGTSESALKAALAGWRSRDSIRRRVVEELEGIRLEGPYWRRVRDSAAAESG